MATNKILLEVQTLNQSPSNQYKKITNMLNNNNFLWPSKIFMTTKKSLSIPFKKVYSKIAKKIASIPLLIQIKMNYSYKNRKTISISNTKSNHQKNPH